MNLHLFTSAACNYFPKAKMLAKSVRRFHPDWKLHIVIADVPSKDTGTLADFFDEIHPASTLDIPGFRSWVFRHNLVEFSTAIKSVFLKELLLRDDCDGVIYLDPDIVVFSPLNEVVTALSKWPIVLTPHLLEPETTHEGILDHEMAALKHGIFNLGFLAVSAEKKGQEFAGWWFHRTYHFCDSDTRKGLFTDQRWMDFAPVFFPEVHILRSPRLNVAPWNISSRKITGQIPDHLLINDLPLGFYHFTGFDSGAHLQMVNKYAQDQTVLKSLIRWYESKCQLFANSDAASASWGYGAFDDGMPILAEMRQVYRSRSDLQIAFPDPFDTSGGGFRRWWRSEKRRKFTGIFRRWRRK